MGHQNEPQGLPDHLMVDPRSQNDVIWDTKNDIKSLRHRLLIYNGQWTHLFMQTWWLLMSKSMTLGQSSRAISRFEAFLVNVCFVLRICPKIVSKCHPKSIKIHPRAIRKPHQKEMPILKRAWEVTSRFCTVAREWIWRRKEGIWEVGEILSSAPVTFQGKVGGYSVCSLWGTLARLSELKIYASW